MKKILFFTILITGLFFISGCENYLEETEVVNLETKESGFVLEEHADQAIVAIYADIRERNGLNGRSAHVLFDCASSDMKVIRESNNVNNYTFGSAEDDDALKSFWRQMYLVIGRCNSAIELVPITEAPQNKVSRYDSEAKVIRAIMYYHLMMTYNTVPLVLETIEPDDQEGMTRGDATREDLYTAIIIDLEEAIANSDFPWEKDMQAAEKGHVGQATARTALTYAYLSRGWENSAQDDFVKAKQYAKQVIDQGGYQLEPILLDAYYKPMNSESIFELVCSNVAGGLGSHVPTWFTPMTVPEGADNNYYGGWYKMASTKKLYDAMEDGDARRFLLVNNDVNGFNDWAPVFLGGDKYGGPVEVIDATLDNDFGEPTFINIKGTGSPADWHDRNGPHGAATNWNIYRLSDVYLLYAEACIKTNDFDEARIYINKVRERARNAWTAYLPEGDPNIPEHVEGVPADIPASVTGDDLLEALKYERRIELSAEMKRMIDIRRWSLGGAKDLENEVNISGTWSSRYKWYPKPKDQIDLSEGNIVQNTGY